MDEVSANLFLQDPSAAYIRPGEKPRRGTQMKRKLSEPISLDSSTSTSKNRNQRQRIIDKDFDESGDDENDLLVDELAESGGAGVEGGEQRVKKRRGSKACAVCRRLKMRCIPHDESKGSKCNRCHNSGQECVFQKSMRGRRAPNSVPATNKKEDLAKSLKLMEGTLASVLKSIGSYGLRLEVPAELASLSSASSSSPPLYPLPPLPSLPSFPSFQGLPPLQSPSLSKGPTTSELIGSERVYSHGESSHSPTSGLGVPATTNQSTPGEEPRLHALPPDSLQPMGLLVEASRRSAKQSPVTLTEVLSAAKGDLDLLEHEAPVSASRRRGIANAKYFLPGPLNIIPLRRIIIEQQFAPVLLAEKIVSFSEVKELFELYFAKCQPAFPILDPVLHTPTATATRSPFLFTTICAVASRFYTARTDDFYHKCLRAARRSAFAVLARGFKSPEICQAFLLLCHWNQPTERYEEERSYQFTGLASRMAQDLNLHRKTPENPHDAETSEEVKLLHNREILNRERTWLGCYITDRAIECQMGKPRSIHREDIIIRNSKRWFFQPASLSTDSGLCMMVELHRIISRILDSLYCDTQSANGLNSALDYPMMVRAFLGQVDQWREDWTVICPIDANDPFTLSRSSMRSFFHHYHRLFILSFAVQQATTSSDYTMDLPGFITAAYEEASSVIGVVRDNLRPQGFFTYCADSCFVYVCYACCFLLKLSSGAFGHLVDGPAALQLVMDGAEVLESVAMDENHTPALYASFIRDLVAGGDGNAGEGEQESSKIDPSPENLTQQADQQTLESFVAWFDNNSDLSNLAGLKSFETMEGMDGMRGEGFWDNMLLPGFGGGLQSNSGVYASAVDPWLFTPTQSRVHSRAASPAPTPDRFSFAH